jgi:hypothetical protein
MRYDHPSEAWHLRKFDRIAIWNRAKIILAITMAIWLAEISILIYGKHLL